MSASSSPRETEPVDPLIDEVRAIRREICTEFGNDVDRLFDHLKAVEREYAVRAGIYAGVTRQAAAQVSDSWGQEPFRTDDPLVDEVRAIRKDIGSRKRTS